MNHECRTELRATSGSGDRYLRMYRFQRRFRQSRTRVVWIVAASLDDVEVLGRPARKQVVGRFKDDFVLTKAGWKIAT